MTRRLLADRTVHGSPVATWRLMVRRRSLLAPLLLTSAFGAHSAPRDLVVQIERALQEEGLSGAVWATVDSNGVVTTGAAGFSNVATGQALRTAPTPVGSPPDR